MTVSILGTFSEIATSFYCRWVASNLGMAEGTVWRQGGIIGAHGGYGPGLFRQSGIGVFWHI